MGCKAKKNNCPCTYDACSRKGVCCECIAYHKSKNQIPGCLFPAEAEKSWDRSIENFIKVWQNKL